MKMQKVVTCLSAGLSLQRADLLARAHLLEIGYETLKPHFCYHLWDPGILLLAAAQGSTWVLVLEAPLEEVWPSGLADLEHVERW